MQNIRESTRFIIVKLKQHDCDCILVTTFQKYGKF